MGCEGLAIPGPSAGALLVWAMQLACTMLSLLMISSEWINLDLISARSLIGFGVGPDLSKCTTR